MFKKGDILVLRLDKDTELFRYVVEDQIEFSVKVVLLDRDRTSDPIRYDADQYELYTSVFREEDNV
jgi:hypothetical protein